MNRTPFGAVVALTASLALILSACGGSSSEAVVEGEAQTTVTGNNAETEVTEPAAVTEPDTTEAGAEPETTEPATTVPETAAATVAVNLFEWVVEAPAMIDGGSVTFEVSNTGTFPHEFAIARGDSYETLPQESNGAVDEEALGADWIGRSDRVPPGETLTISFDLEPGNYVFLCNIASGPNSHASQGQVLNVTVS